MRIRRHVNLFAGLVREALTGGRYVAARKNKSGRHLVTLDSQEGRGPMRSFNLGAFEAVLLSELRGIDPQAVLGSEGPDDTQVLEGRLAAVRASIASIEAEMDEHGESETLYRRLRRLEAEQGDVLRRLAENRQRAAHPLSATWGETRTLLDALDGAADAADARLRLRAAFARMIDEALLLVVTPRGRARSKDRLGVVQVVFAGGEERHTFVIDYRGGEGARKTDWQVRELAEFLPGVMPDLRDRGQAREMEAALADALAGARQGRQGRQMRQ